MTSLESFLETAAIKRWVGAQGEQIHSLAAFVLGSSVLNPVTIAIYTLVVMTYGNSLIKPDQDGKLDTGRSMLYSVIPALLISIAVHKYMIL